MTRAFIHIEAGCVSKVQSDDPDLVVEVIDWDDAEQNPEIFTANKATQVRADQVAPHSIIF
ncbi:hypothetical protein VPH49_21740 [Pseudomonas luteola]|uniref:hypothetical protein n=1 Tax=Pseudomonas luteola TaxID=47886 RepID=UPI003A8B6E89